MVEENKPEYRKLSPMLAFVYDNHVKQEQDQLKQEQDQQALLSSLLSGETIQLVTSRPSRTGEENPTRVVVGIDCETDANFENIDDPHIEINEGVGNRRTGIVALDSLPTLTRHPGVIQVEAAEPMNYYIDVASEYVGVPSFRKDRKLSGKGVVIGIVDTGIDGSHPAFVGRIHAVWDQNVKHGKGTPGFCYGEVYTDAKSIEVHSSDSDGHGTHVCGIAAGADDTYSGIAPGATIIAVKLKSKPMDTDVADAISYIFKTADTLNMPAVVNISLGKQSVPHDGSDWLSKVIDSASQTPGHIVCCAAGNDGNTGIHAQAVIKDDQVLAPGNRVMTEGAVAKDKGVAKIILNQAPANGKGEFVSFSVRGYYPAEAKLKIAVAMPGTNRSAKQLTDFQSVIASADNQPSVKLYDLPGKDGSITIFTPEGKSSDRLRMFIVNIKPPSKKPEEFLNWIFLVGHDGAQKRETRVDLWVTTNHKSTLRFAPNYRSDYVTIGSPGCASSAITVGSYVTKVEWQSIDNSSGVHEKEKSLKLHAIDPSSSRGPQLNGQHKPDLLAPGAMITSCLSQQATPERRKQVDKLHTVMQGTSMAAPFVTGAIALLLEKKPELTAKSALNELRFTKVEDCDPDTCGQGVLHLG